MLAVPEYVHSHASEKRFADLVRQLVFGLGHGMISILGLSIGVVAATGSSRTVAIAGVVGMLTGLATLVALQFLSARDAEANLPAHDRGREIGVCRAP